MITVAIAASSNGDNTIVAGATGQKYRVIAFALSFGGTVNAKFKTGASTDISGLFYGILGTMARSVTLAPPTRAQAIPEQFETASGDALVLNLSTNVAVGGYLIYEKVPASA